MGRKKASLGRASATPRRCDKVVTKSGPQIHGKYCERIITSMKELAPGSIRTLVFDRGQRVVVIGCRFRSWDRKMQRCKTGTTAHAVLKRIAPIAKKRG